MAQNVRDWEKSNQKALCSLGYLLNQIIEVVKGSSSKVAVVRYDGGMKLEVIASEQKMAPSEGVDVKWQDGKQETRDNNLMAKGDQQNESTEIIHEDIPLFDVAFKGIESGYRQCFRLMPNDTTLYRTLCGTYDFLQIDVCKGRTLSEIIEDLKAGRRDDEDRNKSKARDAAFKLVYSILYDTFQSNDKHKNSIFNAVVFVVSHPGTFKWKTRNTVRAVYESRFNLTAKQRANLDQWHKLDSCEQASCDEDDETTEEEDLYWYDSDSGGTW
ncbi:uncharacterized protein BDR25DRAFT_381289 [Lindgomyces ingoldianus]|uniref:Uncharacterized protein n=1 Tax=Lindgomyces ingoldianus TaxID=673940 RepID=A0ACB6QBB4_9PLEO|nr:uncharacterized protein BDR25DRAFT_381289 [Lindgomyces ingoldianus]KAF2464207.1 hypothetical protein BDR25DRAFT_381289 [Lindgomyces ingoldianus]